MACRFGGLDRGPGPSLTSSCLLAPFQPQGMSAGAPEHLPPLQVSGEVPGAPGSPVSTEDTAQGHEMGTCSVTWGRGGLVRGQVSPSWPLPVRPRSPTPGRFLEARCLPVTLVSGTSPLPLREAVLGLGLHLPSAQLGAPGSPTLDPTWLASVAGACHSEGPSSGHTPHPGFQLTSEHLGL